MRINTRLLVAALITPLGLGCEQDRSDSDAGADAAAAASAGAASIINARNFEPSDADAESLPIIDFAMLDQVRPLNLIDDGHRFPESLMALDGKRVSMVGFMAPFDSLNNMRRCMIVPTYVGCNFCSPPNLAQVVYITQGSDDAPQRTYPFIEPASLVTGILRLSLPGRDHEGMQQGFVYSIENAVVTPHRGEAPRPAPAHGTTPHQFRTTALEPIDTADLVNEIAALAGRKPLVPIKIERVSEEIFGAFVRADLETTFPTATRPARTQAFQLLGLLPEDGDWIESLAYFHLLWSVAATDPTGDRIYVLDSVPLDHPYVRLGLVGEIADALTRQHAHRQALERGVDGTTDASTLNDDARRAREALWQGIKAVTIYRYAMERGISLSTRPPGSFVQVRRASESLELRMWDSLPRYIGSFFIRSLVGETGPLADLSPALAQPPATTMEFFRPQWYEDATLWRHDPVPSDFADNLLDTKPILTDVLGIGSLVPMLSQWHSFEVSKTIAGGWVGDRWATWQLPDGGAALILETRWQNEEAALQFRESIPDQELWTLAPHEPGSTSVQVLRADSAEALDHLTAAVLAAR